MRVLSRLADVILFEGIGCPFNRYVDVKPVDGVRDQRDEARINLDLFDRDNSDNANNGQFDGESDTRERKFLQSIIHIKFVVGILSSLEMKIVKRRCISLKERI